jgi:hypothetical protein
MKGVHCSWVDMLKIRDALSAGNRGDQAALEHMRCVDQTTVSDWKAICDVLTAIDGKHGISHVSSFQPSHAKEIARAFRKREKDPARWTPEMKDEAADWVERCEAEELTVQALRAALAKAYRPPPPPVPLIPPDDRWRVDCADCLDWFAGEPADSIDLVFGSPPYEQARLYLENGEDRAIARNTQEWVSWMADVFQAAVRCCTGLVAFVVEGQTEDYRWSAGPALLMAELYRRGVTMRKPPIFKRNGIPGSGGPDWLRNDYEFIVCATNGGRLRGVDNTAMGKPPKYGPGGDPSHRRADGSRVNGDRPRAATARRPGKDDRREGVYVPPGLANPGNVIDCGAAGGGNIGDKICHENEAPFPEYLAEFMIRTFCPATVRLESGAVRPGIVCDPFSGSGTTGAMAVRLARRFVGCDLRQSQVGLTLRRLASAQPPLPTQETLS